MGKDHIGHWLEASGYNAQKTQQSYKIKWKCFQILIYYYSLNKFIKDD